MHLGWKFNRMTENRYIHAHQLITMKSLQNLSLDMMISFLCYVS